MQTLTFTDDGSPATASLPFTVVGADTTTTVRSSKIPARSATRLASPPPWPPPPGRPLPPARSSFSSTGPSGGPIALVNGAATSGPITTLTGGSHAIAANFVPSDGSLNPSTGKLAGDESVTKNATKTVAGPSTVTPVRGQAVTLYAVVSVVAPGTGKPTGTVTFKDGPRRSAPRSSSAPAGRPTRP